MTQTGLTQVFIAATLVISSAANATTFTVSRISDTQAEITGSGDTTGIVLASGIPPASRGLVFLGLVTGPNGDPLLDPASDFSLAAPPSGVASATNLSVSSNSLEAILGSGFVGNVNTGATPSGTLIVTLLAGQSFLPAGLSGNVFGDANGSSQVGTYTIVDAAVPLPVALWLFISAFGGLVAVRTRRASTIHTRA